MIASINAISHSSPTVKYFETILDSATSLLSGAQIQKKKDVSHESLNLAIVSWTENIFEEAKKYEQQLHTQGFHGNLHGIVLSNDKFRSLFYALINLSCKRQLNKLIVEPCLALIKAILIDFPLIGPHTQEVSEAVRECAMLHLRSTDDRIKDLACEILCLIPPMIGHWISNNDLCMRLNEKEKVPTTKISDLHDIKMAFLRNHHESLKPTDFKILADDILKNPGKKIPASDTQNKILKHLEVQAAQENTLEEENGKANLVECITSNFDLQSFWIGYQLAQFCVNNKLKTPLGKAQETLMTIEKFIRQLTANASALSIAKPLKSPESSKNKANEEVTTLVLNISECRRLLAFFELLEKTMVNAWDGSAYHWAGPSGGKPITSFFTANKRTCHDWLSRLRVTVSQLAFYVGEYAFVSRNAFIALGTYAYIILVILHIILKY